MQRTRHTLRRSTLSRDHERAKLQARVQENGRLGETLMAMSQLLDMAVAFRLPKGITVNARKPPAKAAAFYWSVERNGEILTPSGKWVREPNEASRDDHVREKIYHPSIKHAFEAAQAWALAQEK